MIPYREFHKACGNVQRALEYIEQHKIESVEFLMNASNCHIFIKLEFRGPVNSEQAHAIRKLFGINKIKKEYLKEDKEDWEPDLIWSAWPTGMHFEMSFYKVCRIVGHRTETKEVPVYECSLPGEEDA